MGQKNKGKIFFITTLIVAVVGISIAVIAYNVNLLNSSTSTSTSSTSSSSEVQKFTITWKNYDGTILEVDENIPYGILPTYDGDTPIKESDSAFNYHFSGWTPEVTKAKEDQVYTAKFTSSTNQYLITFKNYDGESLQSSNWAYGTTPVYSEATPTKPSDSQYSYTFSGWSPAITPVTGNTTYTAQFTNSTNQYLITFENYDGESLQSSNWAYGTTPVYSEATPTKPGDSQISYTFSGWSPAITPVTGNATYTAQFTSSTNQYLITFENYDGESLQSSNWAYGTTPVYSEATPTKPSDSQYYYTFSGWSPAITPVTGNATYTAQFTSSTNQYLITFENYDGESLQSSNWAYGTTPVYSEATPTKPSDSQYYYTFSGWSPEITAVTGNATYTAQFTNSTNQYLITFKNYNGSTLQSSNWAYGSTPVYSGVTPIKPSDSQYYYTFSGWSPEITAVTGNATYTAQFASSLNSYTITWRQNIFYGGGPILEVDYNVPYGTIPTYDGDTPSVNSSSHVYTFSGWSPEVVAVTGNATYTAQYTSSINLYTVTWKNYDGSILETDNNVPYGTMPIYDGATPSKDSETLFSRYVFVNWSPAIAEVTRDITYTATFLEIPINEKYFLGSYPQTKINDETLITTLNDFAGLLPTSANSQSWTPYNYYISGFNTTKFMWYQDISVGEDSYRGVYFASYRPSGTTGTSDIYNSKQDDNGYLINTRYWFKFEPIAWDVLSVAEFGGPLVLSSKIIDSQEYYHSLSNRNIVGQRTVYPNNYKESNVRSWLNNNFLNTAFSSSEQNIIRKITVANDLYSTGDTINDYSYGIEGTSDKIFLLSYEEARRSDYLIYDNINWGKKFATDYAKAMGVNVSLQTGKSDWWYRSPSFQGAVYAKDSVGYDHVTNTTIGILPAFRIIR